MASGSIQKHTGPRGTSWYAVIDIGPDPVTGKRRQKRVSAPTRKECETLVRLALHAAGTGRTIAEEGLTVRDYFARCLASVEPTVRLSTFRRYSDLVRLRVAPELGSIRLSKLTPLDLQRFYAGRMAAGLSATTVHHAQNVIHRAIKQAMRWGLVERNVTELTGAPRRTLPDVNTWDAKQAAAVLAIGDETDTAALWRLALLCGMRRGELLGLMWDDLDLDHRTLAVRRTLSRGKGGRGNWDSRRRSAVAGRSPCPRHVLPRSASTGQHRTPNGSVWGWRGSIMASSSRTRPAGRCTSIAWSPASRS